MNDPTIQELEAAMVAASNTEGEDLALTRWVASMSAAEREQSRKNVAEFVKELQGSLERQPKSQ